MFIILCILGVLHVGVSERPGTDTQTYFQNYGLTPYIIPVAPKDRLYVRYGSSNVLVRIGEEISPFDTLQRAYLNYKANPNSLYTVLHINADLGYLLGAVSKAFSYVEHLVVNVPGINTNAGDVLSPYISYFPLPGTGFERVVYLVYKQPERINVTTDLITTLANCFRKFNVTKFVDRYNLGDPIAGTFYLTRLCECTTCQLSSLCV